eukprot:92818_1
MAIRCSCKNLSAFYWVALLLTCTSFALADLGVHLDTEKQSNGTVMFTPRLPEAIQDQSDLVCTVYVMQRAGEGDVHSKAQPCAELGSFVVNKMMFTGIEPGEYLVMLTVQNRLGSTSTTLTSPVQKVEVVDPRAKPSATPEGHTGATEEATPGGEHEEGFAAETAIMSETLEKIVKDDVKKAELRSGPKHSTTGSARLHAMRLGERMVGLLQVSARVKSRSFSRMVGLLQMSLPQVFSPM